MEDSPGLPRWARRRAVAAALLGAAAGAVPSAARSAEAAGCEALTFGVDRSLGSCYVPSVEILPGLHIPQSGILHSVDSAEACHDKCLGFAECSYFTFRQHRETGERTCHLKPALSPLGAPRMVVRVFDSSSEFAYISGPRECEQVCEEHAEVVEGCGASTPGSCSALKNAVFDEGCLDGGEGEGADGSASGSGCGVQGYRCCRRDSDPPCSAARVSGFALTGGTLLPSWGKGVVSPDECWSLCVATAGCTHWNWMSSAGAAFAGGACYVYAFAEAREPQWAVLPSFAESVVGGRTCDAEAYGVQEPADLGHGGDSDAPGCLQPNVNVHDATLFTQWGLRDVASCQGYCRDYDHCVAFVYDPRTEECILKYSIETKYALEADSPNYGFYTFGPQVCGEEAAPAPAADCLFANQDIEVPAGVAEQKFHAGFAAQCGAKCAVYDWCQGWSYLEQMCYLKEAGEPLVAAPAVLSGTRECTAFKDYNAPAARRSLAPATRRRLGGEKDLDGGDGAADAGGVPGMPSLSLQYHVPQVNAAGGGGVAGGRVPAGVEKNAHRASADALLEEALVQAAAEPVKIAAASSRRRDASDTSTDDHSDRPHHRHTSSHSTSDEGDELWGAGETPSAKPQVTVPPPPALIRPLRPRTAAGEAGADGHGAGEAGAEGDGKAGAGGGAGFGGDGGTAAPQSWWRRHRPSSTLESTVPSLENARTGRDHPFARPAPLPQAAVAAPQAVALSHAEEPSPQPAHFRGTAPKGEVLPYFQSTTAEAPGAPEMVVTDSSDGSRPGRPGPPNGEGFRPGKGDWARPGHGKPDSADRPGPEGRGPGPEGRGPGAEGPTGRHGEEFLAGAGTTAERLAVCAKQNKAIVGDDIEGVDRVASLEDCFAICSARLDCKFITYHGPDARCEIKYGGGEHWAYKLGSFTVPRYCVCKGINCGTSGDARVAAAAAAAGSLDEVAAATAVAWTQTSLGTFSEWITKGTLPSFTSPSSWQRLALLVLTNDMHEDCFVSDLLQVEKNCWDSRATVLPLTFDLQIVGVAPGADFPGWEMFDGAVVGAPKAYDDGDFFTLYDAEVTISAEQQETGGHGVRIELFGGELPASWPRDLSLHDFSHGRFFARTKAVRFPPGNENGARVVLCLTAADFPLSEICTRPIVIVPTAGGHDAMPEAGAEAI